MKHLFTLLILFISVGLNAQTTVELNINHKLGDVDFELDLEASNNLDNAFEVTRLQYYIAEIKLYEDGTEYLVEDTWLLVNANLTETFDLGSYDISAVDSISFAIGVEEAVNHDDPSTYGNGHPLAHQNPSMHWGWAAGYRFVAMEGNASDDLSDIFQIHSLWDDYYYEQVHVVNAGSVDDVINIEFDADYEKALEDIDVDGGMIDHGSSNEAADLLANFRDLVFTPSSAISSVSEIEIMELNVYPNPLNTAQKINIESNLQIDQLELIDLSGKTLARWNQVQDVDLSDLQPGSYILLASNDEGSSRSIRLVVY